MRAYFTSSLRGKSKFDINYRRIVDFFRKKGLSVYADHILKEGIESEVSSQSEEERESAYKKLLNEIKKSDLLIAEISTPSTSVGHEISYALDLGIPVIVLYTAGKSSALLEGRKDGKLNISEYTLDNIDSILDRLLEEAKRSVDVRFNFFVSPKILSYLDWIAKTKRIPRSVFLRGLIEREMKKDKQFKN